MTIVPLDSLRDSYWYRKGPEHIIVDDAMCSDNELEFPPSQSKTPHPPNRIFCKTPPTLISADTTL